MVCLGSTNLTVYLLNENICWKWLGRKPSWTSSASGISLKPKQQLSSIDLKPPECADEDAVYLATAWRSKGPNSGSCWTEPVHALPTVISSVGTGGWAQSSSMFLPLSSQSEKTFDSLSIWIRILNPTQNPNIHHSHCTGFVAVLDFPVKLKISVGVSYVWCGWCFHVPCAQMLETIKCVAWCTHLWQLFLLWSLRHYYGE